VRERAVSSSYVDLVCGSVDHSIYLLVF
jgi:hypothetical protein